MTKLGYSLRRGSHLETRHKGRCNIVFDADGALESLRQEYLAALERNTSDDGFDGPVVPNSKLQTAIKRVSE
jgi:hypothetical protein